MSASSVMTERDKIVKPKGKAKPFMVQHTPPLVTAPITEDWRRRFKAIHGISESRCVNYKEIYEEMRYGTISDHNLVTIIDYLKYKSKEQLVNQIVNCEAINGTENKENAIEV